MLRGHSCLQEAEEKLLTIGWGVIGLFDLIIQGGKSNAKGKRQLG